MAEDDKIRRWSMYTIIAFNVAVILCIIVYSFIRVGGIAGFYVKDFVVSLVLAGLVAGGVFWACKKLDL